MKSKEALENLYNMACVEAGQKQQFITYAREIEHNENVKKHYDIIKQDLERLEQLEKEEKPYLELLVNNAKYQCENHKLEQENQELKKELQERKEANAQVLNMGVFIHNKNQKLKKAIEILKDKFDFKFNDENKVIYLFIKELSLHIYSWCFKSQQEYELLKEVLE